MKINSRRNSTFIIVGVGIIFLMIVLFQWFLQEDEYALEINRFRKERNEWFRTDPQSPLPDSLKKDFDGITYFEPNGRYNVVAKFVKNPKFEYYPMPQVGDEPKKYIVAGKLEFILHGKKHSLTAFQGNEKDSKALFVPFRDETSGKTTYGGGRYLDPRLVRDRVRLDFNKAYNPFCVYNLKFVCPIPPDANRLKIPITAGEKDYKLPL